MKAPAKQRQRTAMASETLRFLATLLALVLNSAEELSCGGRCNLLMLRAGCQCTASCVKSGTCCRDYYSLCDWSATYQTPVGPSAVHSAAKGAGPVTIGNVSVATESAGFGPAWVSFNLADPRYPQRSVFLYIPPGQKKVPLWFAFHGTNQHADSFVAWTGLDKFAQEQGIALVALQGLKTAAYDNMIRFNVGARSEPISSDGADDVLFVKTVLQAILQLPSIDKDRVHCTGYSNGGRFCSRLGSEMSDQFASIAPVSGLRYPFANNATRAVPICAFHGDSDPINPFYGHGGPYWDISIPDALQDWAKFNKCAWSGYTAMFLDIPEEQMSIALYDECHMGATAKVIKLHGAGHQWPGCQHGIPGLGEASTVSGNKMIQAFFDSKRLTSSVQQEYPI